MTADSPADAQVTALVRDSWPRLLRTAYLLTGTSAAAEDLVQTALLRCLGAWRRHGPPEAAEAYVRTVMVRAVVRTRAARSEVPFAVPPETATADGAEARAESDAVREALRRLPLDQRVVLVLRYWEGLDEAGIADVLQVPKGTVKSRASRGLAALRAAGLLQADVEVPHG